MDRGAASPDAYAGVASPARVERARAALGELPPDPPARTWVEAKDRTSQVGSQPTLLTRATPTWSETWESNPAIPVPKTGGPPWTMSLMVPRVGYAPTSPALQAGAVTRSAVEGHRVRGSNPPRRFEGPATSPDVERGIVQQTISLARSASDGAGCRNRTDPSGLRNPTGPRHEPA